MLAKVGPMPKTKVCSKCKKELPATTEYFSRHKTSKDGLRGICKRCRRKYNHQYYLANLKKCREYSFRNRKRHPQRARQDNLRLRYGITVDQYGQMFTAQGGVCAICGEPETTKGRGNGMKSLAVDHNHKTDRIRELLCNKCNSVLGYVKEDEELLLNILSYLKKWR